MVVSDMMYWFIGACAALIAALWVVYPVVMFDMFMYCVYMGFSMVVVYLVGYVCYHVCMWMVK
jgi:hypothetical protein